MLTHQSVGHNWDRQLCKIWTGSKFIFTPFIHWQLVIGDNAHLSHIKLKLISTLWQPSFTIIVLVFSLNFLHIYNYIHKMLVLYCFRGYSTVNVSRFPQRAVLHAYHHPNSLYNHSPGNDWAHLSTTPSIITERSYGSWLTIKQSTYFPIFLFSNII